MYTQTRVVKWLKEPIFTKKIDPFLNFVLAFLGAMIGTMIYRKTGMPYWQYILWLLPSAFLVVFILKVIGTVWKNSRKQHDME